MAGKSENPPEKLREAQKEHIKANLPKLIELTTLDPITVSTFTQRKILGPGDISKLKSIPDALEKNMEFYHIIQKRLKFFEVLLEAMKDQDEVLEILHKFETGGNNGSRQESGKEVQDVVIGSGRFTAANIVVALKTTSFSVLFGKWTDIARELGTSSDRIDELQKDLLHDKKSRTDVVGKIIEEWAMREDKKATLSSLIKVLENNELKTCAEKLRTMQSQK